MKWDEGYHKERGGTECTPVYVTIRGQEMKPSPHYLLVPLDILLFHGVHGNEIRVDVLVQSKHYCLIMVNDNKVKLSNDEVLS